MPAKSRSVNCSKEAAKALQLPDLPTDAIKNAIAEIVANPLVGIALKAKLSGLRRYRVGRYRIIYAFNDHEIVIVSISHRKDAYR
jgi:mRNA-degrading endonuclease RelE of RelBE toxin-antitoxin system